jgi:signal transduction histidine kinase
MLEVKGAEFAYAQDASFKSFSGYFENDYSKCIIKETLDYKIEKHFGKNGKAKQLANLKKNMEKESIGVVMPVVNKAGKPEGIIILKDKSIGNNFSYEEIAGLRIMPEHAIRIFFKKENKNYKQAVITQDVLLALENKISSLIKMFESSDLQQNFKLMESALNQLIIFIGIFSEALQYRANMVKTDKKPVKLSEIFELTMEELESNVDVEYDKSKVSFDISDKIKNRDFLFDKHLMPQAFEAIGLNALTFNDSNEKQLNIKAYIKDNNLIFDFEDNGIGIKEESFEKIFEPLISENSDYICKGCNASTCFGCRHKTFANGVGLTYAKGIIEAHNGVIFVLKSKPQQTIIRIALPVSMEIE